MPTVNTIVLILIRPNRRMCLNIFILRLWLKNNNFSWIVNTAWTILLVFLKLIKILKDRANCIKLIDVIQTWLEGTWLFLDDRLQRPARPVPRVHYFFIVFFAVSFEWCESIFAFVYILVIKNSQHLTIFLAFQSACFRFFAFQSVFVGRERSCCII